MNLVNILSAINVSVELSSGAELKQACKLIMFAQEINAGEKDTIQAVFRNGPLFDGDMPSKSARDDLVNSGFMAKVVMRGEEGFNACTYKGAELYRLVEAIDKQDKE